MVNMRETRSSQGGYNWVRNRDPIWGNLSGLIMSFLLLESHLCCRLTLLVLAAYYRGPAGTKFFYSSHCTSNCLESFRCGEIKFYLYVCSYWEQNK